MLRSALSALALLCSLTIASACLAGPQPEPPTHRPGDGGAAADTGAYPDANHGSDAGVADGAQPPPPLPPVVPTVEVPVPLPVPGLPLPPLGDTDED